jgi:hypothetical protein
VRLAANEQRLLGSHKLLHAEFGGGAIAVKSFIAWLLMLTALGPAWPADGAGAPDNRVGLWSSEGYGLFLRIHPSGIDAFETTAVSCLPAWKARRAADQDAAWVFRGGFASGDEIIRISPAVSPTTAVLRRSDDLAAMQLHRVSSPPASCKQPVKDTPRTNYDVFWATFAENYPFFPLHAVDWYAADRKFGPLLTPETKPDELFSIFSQMIEPLHDSHVVLAAFSTHMPRGKDWLKTPMKEVWLHKSDPDPFEDGDFDRANQIIESRYIEGKTQRFCGEQIRFGWVRVGQVAYLGIVSFHQYTPDDDLRTGLRCLQAAYDAIFATTGQLKGLVIDVRSNGGGEDAFVLELASRLTDKRYVAFRKQALLSSKGGLKFTVPESIFVEPSDRPRYLGPAVLLIGRKSASAAETFTMALMGRKPRIVRIGENTQGVFSDVLDRRLPNDWRLVLPNEIYVTEDGMSFDVVGVPPDVAAAGFSRDQLNRGRASGLETALAMFDPVQHREP